MFYIRKRRKAICAFRCFFYYSLLFFRSSSFFRWKQQAKLLRQFKADFYSKNVVAKPGCYVSVHLFNQLFDYVKSKAGTAAVSRLVGGVKPLKQMLDVLCVQLRRRV